MLSDVLLKPTVVSSGSTVAVPNAPVCFVVISWHNLCSRKTCVAGSAVEHSQQQVFPEWSSSGFHRHVIHNTTTPAKLDTPYAFT